MLEQLGAIEVESRAGSPHTREQSDTTESVRLSPYSRNLGDRTVEILSSSKYNHTSYMNPRVVKMSASEESMSQPGQTLWGQPGTGRQHWLDHNQCYVRKYLQNTTRFSEIF